MIKNNVNDLLDSTVIIKDIDCSISCNIFLYILSCCPTQEINFFPPDTKDLIEMLMVLVSLIPYPIAVLLLFLPAYYRTSRTFLILIMILLESFIVFALKRIIREPRPNYLCNEQFGFPSNHSCFLTCILFWFVAEQVCLPAHLQFKYKTYLIAFGLIYPFILYSRYYLNYHSLVQIFGGFILGIIIGVGWFLLNIKYFLCNDNIFRQLMIKFKIENNLTDDLLFQDNEYVSLEEYQKENDLNNKKMKLRSANKNMRNMNNSEAMNENSLEILNDNNLNKNEEDVFGEENSDENINEMDLGENNDF